MTQEVNEYLVFREPRLQAQYESRKMPIAQLIEDYIDEKIDIKGDMLEFLRQRKRFVNFSLTADHFKFFITRFIPEVAIHSKKQDERIVRSHYDRGNDFFEAFLGPRMVYTSGFFETQNEGESLEEVQDRKMDLVCQKLQLKPGKKHLDIGCGWGTLAMHSARNFGTDATGITIAEKQTEFGNGQIAAANVQDRARILCLDYRDIPADQYDGISCLEMAEHVGVKNFQKFLRQVYGLMKDDGLFYLQIAGLRKGMRPEDLVWGLFMNKYIFSGADASMPLGYVVSQLEKANFEVFSVESMSTHYVYTITLWYRNWIKNRAKVMQSYGEWWFRLWEVFLAWSILIGEQGSSRCYGIIAHKNLDDFDRRRWIKQPVFGHRPANPRPRAEQPAIQQLRYDAE